MKQVGWALQIVSHSRRSSMSVQVPFMVHPGKQLQERELHWHKNPTRAVTWQVAAKLQSLCFKESAQQTNMRQRRRHHQLHTDHVPQPSQLFPLADGCCMLPQRISLAGRSSVSPACCNSMVTAQSSAAGALDREFLTATHRSRSQDTLGITHTGHSRCDTGGPLPCSQKLGYICINHVPQAEIVLSAERGYRLI